MAALQRVGLTEETETLEQNIQALTVSAAVSLPRCAFVQILPSSKTSWSEGTTRLSCGLKSSLTITAMPAFSEIDGEHGGEAPGHFEAD